MNKWKRFKWEEPTQQFNLLFTVKRDGRPASRTGDHRAQDKQKYLVEWVGDLGLLARVIKARKELQKFRRVGVFGGDGHEKSPKQGKLNTFDSEKSPFVSNLFNRLPAGLADRDELVQNQAAAVQ